jgi:hypothetical protein
MYLKSLIQRLSYSDYARIEFLQIYLYVVTYVDCSIGE